MGEFTQTNYAQYVDVKNRDDRIDGIIRTVYAAIYKGDIYALYYAVYVYSLELRCWLDPEQKTKIKEQLFIIKQAMLKLDPAYNFQRHYSELFEKLTEEIFVMLHDHAHQNGLLGKKKMNKSPSDEIIAGMCDS